MDMYTVIDANGRTVARSRLFDVILPYIRATSFVYRNGELMDL